ncbi:MAG: hypothetical protein AUI14_06200 [Actinobacteria bacterium 13_2_20CM_2_71_6]|jgi:hypothetical protein|nr:MAG: hypothetical protein AUI14_06200 [Actinobacteria bacterium 13_2_20CM_2_71_6]
MSEQQNEITDLIDDLDADSMVSCHHPLTDNADEPVQASEVTDLIDDLDADSSASCHHPLADNVDE